MSMWITNAVVHHYQILISPIIPLLPEKLAVSKRIICNAVS